MHPSPTPATQHRHYLKPLPLSLHTMNHPPCQSVDKILNQKLLISVDAGYIHTYKHICLVIMIDTIRYDTGRSLFDDGWDIHYIIRYVHDSVPVHSCAKTVIRLRTLVFFIKERKEGRKLRCVMILPRWGEAFNLSVSQRHGHSSSSFI